MTPCIEFPLHHQYQPTPLENAYSGVITAIDAGNDQWIIDQHFTAPTAVSLLRKPEAGDLVYFVRIGTEFFITQILQRQKSDNASRPLSLESDQPLYIHAPELKLSAWHTLELTSVNTLSVAAEQGSFCFSGTLIQQSENLIQQVGHMNLTARGLLRLNAKQQLITAEEDVRIDGKRINMG